MALDKVGFVSSGPGLAQGLEARLGALVGKRLGAVTNLGIADTAGLALRAPWTFGKAEAKAEGGVGASSPGSEILQNRQA